MRVSFAKSRSGRRRPTERAGPGPACGPVFLTFDDGTADHRRAADLLSTHSLTGTFFVITGRLGSPGYLSEEDVRSIAAQGHRIASHSVTHRHLTLLNAAELTEELVASRERLEALAPAYGRLVCAAGWCLLASHPRQGVAVRLPDCPHDGLGLCRAPAPRARALSSRHCAATTWRCSTGCSKGGHRFGCTR